MPTYQAGRFVKSEVFELPFMAKNAETGSPALWEYVQKNSLDEFKGVKLLAHARARRLAAALLEQAREERSTTSRASRCARRRASAPSS